MAWVGWQIDSKKIREKEKIITVGLAFSFQIYK